MKNQNKVRNYWGYVFIFEDSDMMVRFLQLYKDLFIDYEFYDRREGKNVIKIQVGKGVIGTIKNGLGDLVEVTKHKHYYVRKAA